MSTPARAPYFSLFCLSAAALAYEILLIRLFSIIQWHHYAQIIISLALLGYGVSGTFLSVVATIPKVKTSGFFIVNVLLFSIAVVVCFSIAQNISFNPEELFWDSWQALALLFIYIILSIPFFFAANAIGISFIVYKEKIAYIYAADLSGASAGSLLIVGILWIFAPEKALLFPAFLGICALIIAMWELKASGTTRWKVSVIALISMVFFSMYDVSLVISPYKDMAQTMRISATKIIGQRSSPLGLVQVVESPKVPFRQAPGLSLNSTTLLPKQLALFIDGDSMMAITQDEGKRENFAYLDETITALAYHLGVNNSVLILGANGGAEIQQARYHQVDQIDVIEPNAQIITLLQTDFAQFSGRILNQPNIRVFNQEYRGYVANTKNSYDIIQLIALNSFSASSTGLYALSEGYNFTTQALVAYINRLSREGKVSITLWNELPPRKALKLFATAISALQQIGVQDPAQHLLLIRNWQTSTLIIKKTAINSTDILALKTFCQSRLFDVAYYPSMPASEANQSNILNEAYYYQAAEALLGSHSAAFMTQYKYALEPSTDDKPFVSHFFKWSTLPEIISLLGEGGMPLMEWGYILLLFALLQALLLAVLLIVLPLVIKSRTKSGNVDKLTSFQYLTYFSCLGLAFLFIEIAYMQKFVLFLAYPIYASAIILMAFLLFAGLGSSATHYLVKRYGYNGVVSRAIVFIIFIGLIYLPLCDYIFTHFAALPLAIKIIVSSIIVAPLAFCMGMPFPIGLQKLTAVKPELVPLAWGINGFASVVSAILASLLAMSFGFTNVIIMALLLYALAALIITRRVTGFEK